MSEDITRAYCQWPTYCGQDNNYCPNCQIAGDVADHFEAENAALRARNARLRRLAQEVDWFDTTVGAGHDVRAALTICRKHGDLAPPEAEGEKDDRDQWERDVQDADDVGMLVDDYRRRRGDREAKGGEKEQSDG